MPMTRRTHNWRQSLIGKFTLVCVTGVIVAYSIGFLLGWNILLTATQEQWKTQALTTIQVASATLRGIYTYASVSVDQNGHVTRLASNRPIGDDDSILFTGFSPIDVLGLIAVQTTKDAWLFKYNARSGLLEPVAATVKSADAETPIDPGHEPLFDLSRDPQATTGFAKIDGVVHYVGVLPIVTQNGTLVGVVATSIGRQDALLGAQNGMLRNAALVAMTVLLLTIAAVSIMTKRLLSAVPRLIDAVLHIASERTDITTPFQDRTDEIGDLAIAIEALRGAVEERGRLREIRDMAIKLDHMAHHDPLTGLANRALLMRLLDERVAGQAAHAAAFNVLMLDLDRFKAVNDTLGHAYGDELLVETAQRVMQALGPSDMAARLGGDEFAVIQIVANDGVLEASLLADRLLKLMSAEFSIFGQDIVIGMSVGIARAPRDGATGSALLRSADLALYRAKAAGRNTYRFFEPGMDMAMRDQKALGLDLRQALKRTEFSLHFQPIVATGSGAVVCFEALLRWNHPKAGPVAPARFIPLAEETGLIVPIGAWVLREACAIAATWPDSIKVAVNMSPVQIRSSGVVDVVLAALTESGLPAERLELEITETAMLHGEASINALYKLQAMGIRIALDDFGTGYASLSNLTMFPYQKIKIDRSFVANLTSQPDARAIVAAVTNLAQGLGMDTTAEGVETEDQLILLRAAGCTSVQGYFLDRPKPAHAISFETRRIGQSSPDKSVAVDQGGPIRHAS
jgi:diguanylate cyclase (GGDEF)-like protein